VFLLSLRAAGTGLNLTAASYVVLFDPWWNPAVEAQAIDRTHRIGQTSQVIAYRLLAKDTVEEKIRRLQQDKAALARAIVEEDNVAQVMDLASLRLVLGRTPNHKTFGPPALVLYLSLRIILNSLATSDNPRQLYATGESQRSYVFGSILKQEGITNEGTRAWLHIGVP